MQVEILILFGVFTFLAGMIAGQTKNDSVVGFFYTLATIVGLVCVVSLLLPKL